MISRVRSSVLLLCKKPLRAGAGLLAILGLLAVAGYAWNEFQFRAAVRALDSQKFAEGIKHLQLVWPKGLATHFLLARTLRRNSAFDDAEHELQGCEQLGEAYTLEAVLLRVQQGDLEGAESTLRQRAESDSAEAPLILEVLAQAYLRTYQFDRALDCINRLLKGQPNHVLALQWHGQMMEHINRREEAVEDYRRALAVNPDDKSARLSLGDLLLNLNRYADSLEQFDYLRRRWPDDPAVRLGVACCQRGLGRSEEARQLLDALLLQHPDEARVLYERGKIALDDGEMHRAEDLLRRAQARSPFDDQFMYTLYQCLVALQKHDEARRVRTRLDEISKDRVRLVELTKTVVEAGRAPAERAEAGNLCLRLGMTSQAFSLLSTALQEDPDNLQAAQGLVAYYERVRDLERAAAYRRLVETLKQRTIQHRK